MSTTFERSLSSAEEIWGAVLSIIKENINERSFSTWFAPTRALEINNSHLRIAIPNRFFCEWIEKHYNKHLQNAIAQTLGETKKIEYVVDKQQSDNDVFTSDVVQPKIVPDIVPPQKINSPYYTKINERYVFENFVVGDSNNFAYAASRAVADSPGKTNYNPLIVYGGTGLGKTHLIQAIGNYALMNNGSTKVYYASSETFTSHFIGAIQQNRVSEFSAFFRSCDILLLDDIHFFSNKGKTQEEFFHTFNDLHQNGKQIILTSDRPINELEALEERLISRFKWGLIVDIQPPDYETRLAILRKKCAESGLEISHEILEYLAVNLMDNVRELEGALTKILAKITFTDAELSLELARSIVTEIGNPDKNILTIEKIMDYTAKVFDLPVDQLRAKTRKKDVVQARQVAMYLSKNLTRHSLITIGLHFGGRDHTTVIHALENVRKNIQSDPVFSQRMESMKKHLDYTR